MTIKETPNRIETLDKSRPAPRLEALREYLVRGAAAMLIRLKPRIRPRSTAEGYQDALAARNQRLAFAGTQPPLKKRSRDYYESAAATRVQGLGGRFLRGRFV